MECLGGSWRHCAETFKNEAWSSAIGHAPVVGLKLCLRVAGVDSCEAKIHAGAATLAGDLPSRVCQLMSSLLMPFVQL